MNESIKFNPNWQRIPHTLGLQNRPAGFAKSKFYKGKEVTTNNEFSGFIDLIIMGVVGLVTLTTTIIKAVDNSANNPNLTPEQQALIKNASNQFQIELEKIKNSDKALCASSWITLQKILEPIQSLVNPSEFKYWVDIIGQGIKKANDFKADYNAPNNVLRRKYYYVFDLLKAKETPELLYAAKILTEECNRKAINIGIVTGRGNPVPIVDGRGSIVGGKDGYPEIKPSSPVTEVSNIQTIRDILANIQGAKQPAGWISVDAAVNFPPELLRFHDCQNPPATPAPVLLDTNPTQTQNPPAPSTIVDARGNLPKTNTMYIVIFVVAIIAIILYFAFKK